MAGTRRMHNKTRLGCGVCKKRRIKCDGRHPTCENCEKKGVECSFLLLVPSRPSPTAGSPGHLAPSPKALPPYEIGVFRQSAPSSRSTTPPSVQGGVASNASGPKSSSPVVQTPSADVWNRCRDSLGPNEQMLLDYYVNSTCGTLATDADEQYTWRTLVPSMALEHRYLVHGVLSISALDLARLHEGEERDKLHRTAAEQMNRAISIFRVELNDINERNANALFGHSTLTAVYFFRTSALDMQAARASIPAGLTHPPAHVADEMLSSFFRIVQGLRGALCVLKPGWNWVVEGELAALCDRKWWPKHRRPIGGRAKEEDQRLADLEKLWLNPDRPYEEHFKHLSAALFRLRETYALVALLTDPDCDWPRLKVDLPYLVDETTVGRLKDRAAVFVWGVQVEREFIALAEQKNREALLLIAYYGVLIGRIQSVWWMEGVGANTVWAVAQALGPENRHLVEWPIQTLRLDLEAGSVTRSPEDATPSTLGST